MSVNTTKKCKFYCDRFRPHRAIIRLIKWCLWTLIITICLRAFELLEKHNIQSYFRHVDDTLLVHKEHKTNIHMMLNECNELCLSMKFTLQREQSKIINFLDITVTKNQKGLSFEIYRKPTSTDMIIPNDWCHPKERKRAAVRYYYNRMETYRLTPENRQKERDTIRQIMTNNNYVASSLDKLNNKRKRQKQDDQIKAGQSLHA